jgi:hypothetical protein
MTFNIAYAKKHFVCFVLKSIIRYNIYLIAMDDWWFVIMCCLIEDCPKKDRCAKHSQYCKDYHTSLDIFHRRLWQRKIPRCSLQEQSQSAWCCLYESRNDQGMITLTGFDCAMFNFLCEIFTPIFESYTPFVPSGVSCFEHTKVQNRGRPWMIWPEDGLGLVLAWTRTRGLLMVLQLIFGMMYTNLDDYLLFAKRKLSWYYKIPRWPRYKFPAVRK